MSTLNITVCGGGNGAHACAALMAQQGHKVRLFSPITYEIENIRRNYSENDGLSIIESNKVINKVKLEHITDDANTAFQKASIVFVIVPSFAHKPIFRHIAKNIEKDALVVVMPCRGLMELDVKRFLPNISVIACQTLPWACRLEKPGSRINIKGAKNKIQVAHMPFVLNEIYDHLLEELLSMKIERVKNMMTMTFANIGQIFHPGIMYSQFKSNPNQEFSREDTPLFYQGVTAEGADILERLAHEIHEITLEVAKIDDSIELEKILSPSEWLMESYGNQIENRSTLQTMLNSNTAYKGITVPTIEIDKDRYMANFSARYVTEDVPYSLLVTRTIGNICGVETPMMDEVINSLGSWIGQDWIGQFEIAQKLSTHSRLPVFYGCETIYDFIN
ncbi:NAD-dependent glycerol-3-phosphate dehydrogenase N-terminus [Dethiosulfatibacter aminovorans DSM 17477]|uniref:NAD-dependent glycerol-3-phosphate dehydrogenase N-terminus n=1 Tax=Dethiosulfatibacter aminovorans DSM 17477 TaxID=1121476 RepID=A0A1M6N3S3_9FIRM|nr:NAD/NADP-dependent octopine/nopaline dehydrogenase family protein [Dethiosulfatibacter aminovorans]SHJ90233.1 NAD-dependent glycerol-3-phosphate dehydrogenase N-terminus [Dethiosulfatibacter aminovorans DSM 17477]